MNKQEFLNGQIVLYNGDCLDVMRNLKDKEIDLVLTDPPYGLSYDKAAAKKSGKQYGKAAAPATKFHSTNWDILPDQKIFNELLRISKNQIIFGAEHLCLMLPKSRGWIVWDKNTGENNFSDCELAWTSFDKPIRKFFYTWNGMIQQNMADKEVRIHPTQKPTGLINWCLLNSSKENDLIFDGFLGSGTTAIACIRTKRRLIGCELDNEYFDKMCKRIEEELRQGNLF
jgi:site-specific DNA-methyltransferase (adenine-specific)